MEEESERAGLKLHIQKTKTLASGPFVKWSRSVVSDCDPVDCSPPGSSIHGILQARILEQVAISFSRRSSQPRDLTQVSCIAGRRFNLWAVPLLHSKQKGKRWKQGHISSSWL